MNAIIFIISVLVLISVLSLFLYKRSYITYVESHKYVLAIDSPKYINKFKKSKPILINVSSSIKYEEDGLNELRESVSLKLGLINKEEIRIIYKGFE